MKRNTVWWIIILCIGICHDMNGQRISGRVVDFVTEVPIPYVNIGVVGTEIGTTSDCFGSFELIITDALDGDNLRFSYVGYEAQDLSVSSLREGNKISEIRMQRVSEELAVVTITTTRSWPRAIGVPKKKCYPIPLFKKATSNIPFPQESYRHEIGTFFTNEKVVHLDSIQINLSSVDIDTLRFRLNIYVLKGDHFVQLLKTPIYVEVNDAGISPEVTVSISDRDLYVEGPFLVTIENYKQIEDGACRILANFRKEGRLYPTYYRSSSHSNWRVLKRKSRDFGLSIMAFLN